MTQENESKQDKLILDVSAVQNSTDFHCLLKKDLELPDFHGMNWDAFFLETSNGNVCIKYD